MPAQGAVRVRDLWVREGVVVEQFNFLRCHRPRFFALRISFGPVLAFHVLPCLHCFPTWGYWARSQGCVRCSYRVDFCCCPVRRSPKRMLRLNWEGGRCRHFVLNKVDGRGCGSCLGRPYHKYFATPSSVVGRLLIIFFGRDCRYSKLKYRPSLSILYSLDS